MRKEIKQLIEWSDAYYNNKPIVSDEVFDKEYARLKELYPDDDFFKSVGAKATGEVVTLKNVMGSLNKENPESVIDWIENYSDKTFLISPKLDGLSLKVIYKNGKRVQVVTRGNGFEGQDITARAKYIGGIPKRITLNGYVEVNGECICYKSLFKKYYAKEYSFPRNFCVGTLRPIVTNKDYLKLLNEDESLKKRLKRLQFIAFSCNFKNCERLSKETSKFGLLLQLQGEGFSSIIRPSRRWKYEDQKAYNKTKDVTVLARCKQDIELPFKCLLDSGKLTSEFFKNAIKAVKSDLDINCDGVVVEVDDLRYAKKLGLEANGLNPKSARAVKLKAFDQGGKITVVKDIVWNISKRGNFIPTINVKTTNIEGANIDCVTGNNIEYLKDMGIGIGAKVRLVRSGDVIPRIVEVIEGSKKLNAPDKCPYCGKKLKHNDAHIYCANSNCEGIKIKKLISFFSIAKVDFMSESTIHDLVEAGYDTVKKILKLTPNKLMQLEGFQKTKANKICNSIKEMTQNVSLAQLMHATGFFDDELTGLGSTKIQWIIDYLGIDNLLDNKVKSKLKNLDTVKGISTRSANLFILGYNEFMPWWYKHQDLFELTDFNEVEDGPLTGMKFCWTGFRDKNLKQLIEENGGIIKDNLTKDTDVLFSAGDSSKTRRANELGIKIIPSGKAISYIQKFI